MIPPPSTNWRVQLAPWRRAIAGKLSLSLSPVYDVAPTREDLASLTVNVSMARIGHDRGLWCAVLEALELLNMLFTLDPGLCWAFLLEACDKSPARVAFPISFLHDVRPTYVLHFLEADLAEGFEQITEIFDVVVFGIAEWNHSPLFRHVEALMLADLNVSESAFQLKCIELTCQFQFEDDPISDNDERLECLEAIRCLAAFLQEYQPLENARAWDDSSFLVESFGFDFGDCVLLCKELHLIIDTMIKMRVSSLTFAAWQDVSTSTRYVELFRDIGLAPGRNMPQKLRGGLQSLTLYPVTIPNDQRNAICNGVCDSRNLTQFKFSDEIESDEEREAWLASLVVELFGKHVPKYVDSVHFKITLSSFEDIFAVRDALAMHFAEDVVAVSPGQLEPVVNRVPVIEFVPIQLYRIFFFDFAASGQDSPVLECPPLPQSQDVRLISVASSKSEPLVSYSSNELPTLPPKKPFRMSNHLVKNLTVSLTPVSTSEASLTTAVALLWLVGEPLRRLTISGPESPDVEASLLFGDDLEQILTACPNLQRLTLLQVDIETLEPLLESSLTQSLHSLVIDRCHVLDRDSLMDFYSSLGKQDSALHASLQDLFMGEQDEGDIDSAYAAVKMLSKNQNLQRFVLRGYPDGVALKMQHRFESFNGQPVAGPREAPLPLPAKLAFLSSILSGSFPNAYKLFNDNVMTRIFSFASLPQRRHCCVIGA